MPTFAQLLAEGFAVALVAALLTGLLSIACAVAIDPVRPFGEVGTDAATRFFTPPNQRKSHENQNRANERPTNISPALPAAEARAEYHHRDPGQEYLELNLQDLLDHIHDAQSPGRTQ